MRRVLTRTDANQTLRVTPERHREVKVMAASRSASLIDIADEVIAAGIEAIRKRRDPGVHAPSSN